ncbi:hypothetical protein A45J_1843 [hot springs metagenome]|uniref:Uncharacterized protein n=1 Tax=hot springs metagenome TaxID=433727 RepID=A0A5J4L1J1_9ZZZZ
MWDIKIGVALLGVAAAITFHLNHVGYKDAPAAAFALAATNFI